MLHLGLGSFHRAHQAVYLHQLMARGDRRWALAGGNLRPDMAHTIDALRAQQGHYTLETVTPEGEREYLLVESIRTIVPWEPGLTRLVELGAQPGTRIISCTVTEAGYYLDPSLSLDRVHAEIAADIQALRQGRAGSTIYGALAAILRARMRCGAGPVTLLNCDNLRHNGDRLLAGLTAFLQEVGDPALTRWVEANTSTPNAMVDRITPRPTAEVVERVRAATGRHDPAALMAESFIQWVIEDRFTNGRPEWEAVSVEMVDSVDAHEEAKIRLLNGTHSCIAWAGTLAGTRYIHEGVADARIRRMAHDYATQNVIPVLSPSPIDLGAYRDTVLHRFANAALQDTNQRVAMDGYSKLPGFIVPTIAQRLARNDDIEAVALLPALFLACLHRWHAGTLPYEYQDQAMDPAAAHAICAAPDPVAAFAADRVLWGELAGHSALQQALRRAAARVDAFARGPGAARGGR
ncbi:D-arabinitol 4-dehydrogenase [Ramlibacter tataouinensis]|nr:D-arabinitol 4-dehydrogenase [Ramlibacter tataouinensis]